MGNLKCPWQTVKTRVEDKKGTSTTTVSFADCLKSQCPFWQEQKHIGYCNTIQEHCMRAKGEIGE
jgi:hypothetical protein